MEQMNIFSTTENSDPVEDNQNTAETEELVEEVKEEEEGAEEINSENILDDLMEDLQSPKKKEKEKEEEKPVETKEGEEDSSDKKYNDAQSMIGRQGNEIGSLREKIAALEEKNVKKEAEKENSKPYWELMSEASDEEIVDIYKSSNEGMEEEDIDRKLKDIKNIKGTAKLVKDILAHELKDIKGDLAPIKQAKEEDAKAKEFIKTHEDFSARQAQMKIVIDKIYPNGTPANADHYLIADMAYNLVGTKKADTKKQVKEMNNKQILSTRTLNSSTSTPTKNLKSNREKLNPLQKALEKEMPGLYG